MKIIITILFLIMPTCSFAYDRAEYKHWIDANNDCQDTRQEVLIRESIAKPKLDQKGCKVVSGLWHDFYTGKLYKNPSELDIDHVVPLAEVDITGGNKWSAGKKMEYANDLEVLVVSSQKSNRSKGSKTPDKWLPKNKNYWCQYIIKRQEVKRKYELTSTKNELLVINRILSECYEE